MYNPFRKLDKEAQNRNRFKKRLIIKSDIFGGNLYIDAGEHTMSKEDAIERLESYIQIKEEAKGNKQVA